MKNKELLLERDPKKSPVRFIFSHSALREGWDNPNVFQICTLKQSSSNIRKRQEVGRGLRLAVNSAGERMDESILGSDVHNVNILTVIASESYETFAKELQKEIAEAVGDRPLKVSAELFIGKVLIDANGNEKEVDNKLANVIFNRLIKRDYIDDNYNLTDKYYTDKENNTILIADEFNGFENSIVNILNSIYDKKVLTPKDARKDNIEARVDENKKNMKEFKELWNRINSKSIYMVDFNSEELVKKAIEAIDSNLNVSKIYFHIKEGYIENIPSKELLESGAVFVSEKTNMKDVNVTASSNVKYDLVGKLAEGTDLTRKAIVQILKGIREDTFNKFKENPEEFIIKATSLINESKTDIIIEHITYNRLSDKYDENIFTDSSLRGRLGTNAIKTEKHHLYDHLIYDSNIEKEFAQDLENSSEVAIYVKLPRGFYIPTPLGRYNPDWAIAFNEGTVKHIYFVAETKGSNSSTQLRKIEEAKIGCAEKHFEAISNSNVKYSVVKNYKELLNLVM